jgi:putative addiction module component (TIGR02574 family)
MAKPHIDIDTLTTDERLDLIEQLWESLESNSAHVPLSEAQNAELDRRLDEMEQDGAQGIPWEEVLKKIRTSK